jgi:hypothetical protein
MENILAIINVIVLLAIIGMLIYLYVEYKKLILLKQDVTYFQNKQVKAT